MVGDISALLGVPMWALVVFLVWSLIWKALALWKSARKNSPVWFVILLVVNTAGILEVLYIFLFSEMKFDGGIERRVKKQAILDKKVKRKKK